MSNPNLPEVGKATRFKPGQSGNPTGRPKQAPLTDELKKLLRQKASGSQWTNAHMVAWKMIQRAQAGDVGAARLIWEYVEGKPDARVDLYTWLDREAERVATAEHLDKAEVMREAELYLAGMRR